MRKRLVMAVVAKSLMLATMPAMLLALMVGLPPAMSPAAAQSDLEQARAAVGEITERLEELVADLDATQQRGDELAQAYWQVQSGVERLELDIAANETVAAELAERIVGLRDEVKVIAVDQYMNRSEHVGVADHESEADRAAAEALARLLVGTDNEAIDALAAAEAEQDRILVALEDQRIEQVRALASVEQTQAEISDELRRLGELQADLSDELDQLEGALDELEQAEARRQAAEAEQARIAEERARAEAAAAEAAQRARLAPPTVVPTSGPEVAGPAPTPTEVPNPQPSEPFPSVEPEVAPTPTEVPNPQPSAPSGGGIVCPLAGPFTHTDDFNSPRAVGGIHRANDLISDAGTPVLAVASGTLQHKESSVGGLSAHLRGDNGDYYFYTHLSGYENVGAGHVAAGTVIGYVGETGNAPIPHLHFEIHSGGYGNYTNPYGPVRAACF